MTVDILAFGAHPDDIEFGAGAILAKEAAKGKKIVMCDLTLGQKGTNGTPDIRRKEATEAASLIGAERRFLDFIDCEVIDSYENRLKLTRIIREYQPTLVLAPVWTQDPAHPDHIHCGTMARYACRYARFTNILPDIPIHKVSGILHYATPMHRSPDFLFDVTDHIEIWQQMMNSHATQMQTINYTDLCMRFAANNGLLIGKQYAQGLIKGNPLEIEELLSLSKGSVEL